MVAGNLQGETEGLSARVSNGIRAETFKSVMAGAKPEVVSRDRASGCTENK